MNNQQNIADNLAINWVDGMKIDKDHFLHQDLHHELGQQINTAAFLSGTRFGILPSTGLASNFEMGISIDNQQTLRINIIQLKALTQGGSLINWPAILPLNQPANTDGSSNYALAIPPNLVDGAYWIVMVVHPQKRLPFGTPSSDEIPPRLPYLVPTYTMEFVSQTNMANFWSHPNALCIGKAYCQNGTLSIDENYLPPCITVSAHPDLVGLLGEIDKYLSALELNCSQIVQKVLAKNQQNEISELVMFVCDRLLIYLSQSITQARWLMLNDSPTLMLASIAGLGRLMKNAIDMRIGSGKEEMLNYFSEWTQLKQGEFENLLTQMAMQRFNMNDINENIENVISFVKVTGQLFATLAKLEFIGKKKETGIFVTEGNTQAMDYGQPKPKRRFFG